MQYIGVFLLLLFILLLIFVLLGCIRHQTNHLACGICNFYSMCRDLLMCFIFSTGICLGLRYLFHLEAAIAAIGVLFVTIILLFCLHKINHPNYVVPQKLQGVFYVLTQIVRVITVLFDTVFFVYLCRNQLPAKTIPWYLGAGFLSFAAACVVRYGTEQINKKRFG